MLKLERAGAMCTLWLDRDRCGASSDAVLLRYCPLRKARQYTHRDVVAAFAIAAGFVPAAAEDRPSDPFGDVTVELNKDAPLAKIWELLRDKMLIEKGYFHKCLEFKDCPSMPTLLQTLDEIRQYQGKAMLGHLNLSVNLMVKPAPGDWTTPPEAITMRTAIANPIPSPNMPGLKSSEYRGTTSGS